MREDKSITTTMEYGYSDDQDLLDEIMRDYACYAREYDTLRRKQPVNKEMK
jgi:hypothetical protein